MKKIIVLTLALILALSLAACSFEFGGGTSGGGDPTNSKPTSGDTAQTPDDTSEPPNGETTKPPTDPPSVGDPVAVNALVGTWWMRGWAEIYYWTFGTDGNFAYYVPTISPNVDYWDEYFIKGKYRVNGNAIEFYDCYFDSDHINQSVHAKNVKYFGDSERINMPQNKLLETPLKDPKKIDDFKILFEFFDALRLRIVSDRSGLHGYDSDFSYLDYNGNGHKVTIPTHSLPGLAWPKDKIPSGVPEYNDGRIRVVDTSRAGQVSIIVDRTTRDYFANYINNLILLGWKASFSDVWISDAMEGSGVSYLEKGKANISIESRGNNSFYISFWGSW